MVHSVTISHVHVAATRLSGANNFQAIDFSLEGQIPDMVEVVLSTMWTI